MMLNLRSQREINSMREAGNLVYQAHQITTRMIRPGITTREIDAAIEELFAEQGAVPLFLNYPGEVPFPAVTCISVNDEIVHGIPGDRVLHEGDIVSVDTGCKIGGWCGDAAVTHAVGKIDDESTQLLEVTSQVLELAIEQLTKCSKWSEVAQKMQSFVHDHGFSVVEEFVGHGIGRELHESPQIPNYYDAERSKKIDFKLRTGLVLAIEPMVNIGSKHVKRLDDHWTASTRDGKNSAHFEHTVALTSDGPLILTGPDQ